MALWRPCGRLIQAFGKFPVSCQVEYIRSVVRLTRIRGYVAVSPKPGCSITSSEKLEVPSVEKLEVPSVGSAANDITPQNRLVSLCFGLENGRISREDLARILENVAGGMDEGGLSLLRYCGNVLTHTSFADRRILASHVWEIIRRDPSALTLEHHNTLLDICKQNRQPVEPQKFLAEMTVKPDGTTYKLLMNIAATCGDVESVLYIVSRMKDEGYPLTEGVFNLLIRAHGANKDIKSVLSTLETMKTARIEPTANTYANIAYGYAAVGDFHNTMKILNAYPLDEAQLMDIVKRFSDSNLSKHIPDVLKFMTMPVNPYSRIFVNTLTELTHSGKPEDAFQVINCLIHEAAGDTQNLVLDGFLKDMIRAKIPTSTVLELMDRIIATKNYPMAINDVCEGALYCGERDLAMAVFEVMHERGMKVRPHYYWPLLIQASRADGETGVFRTLRHMICLDVALDYDTIVTHVLPRINTVDALITLRKFGDLGLETSVIFTPLICYLLHQGRAKEAVSLCSKIKAPIDFDRVLDVVSLVYKQAKNIGDYLKIFKYAPHGKHYPEKLLFILFGKNPSGRNVHALNYFLRAFEAANIPVSRFTPAESRQADGTNGEGELTPVNPLDFVLPSDRIPHPRDMNLDELECHLIELKAKGMHVRGILRKLLQFHCRENNLKRVEEIKNEYDENGFVWTPGMYSSLMQLYALNDRLEDALSLHSKIKECKDFQLDDFKTIQLARALVKADLVSEAFAIISPVSSTGGTRMTKDCWRLLDAIAHSSSYELTESMLDILVNGGFCERSNNLMGPMIRAHLLRDDLTSAVRKFAECAERYGCTPLRQELVYALVKKINSDKSSKDETIELLEEVQTITTKIRGNGSNKLDLLVVLARLGKTDELRKFLLHNKIRKDVLANNLAYVPENEKLQILTTLLDASVNVPGINRSLIYEELLAVHSRYDDCQKAVELWTRWSEEAPPVSPAFATVFESLLTKHNVPLPESFSRRRSPRDSADEST